MISYIALTDIEQLSDKKPSTESESESVQTEKESV